MGGWVSGLGGVGEWVGEWWYVGEWVGGVVWYG